jgi:excisionase family DNA binding protein
MKDEKLLFTFGEVSGLAEISQSMIRKLVRKGQIEVVRIGRSVRISRQELLRLCGVGNNMEASK